MASMNEYRGVQISRNFTSTNGTGAKLKAQRGWMLELPGYGSLGWVMSQQDAVRHIDALHAECAPAVRRALDKTAA
jgi:hypothetical protein